MMESSLSGNGVGSRSSATKELIIEKY